MEAGVAVRALITELQGKRARHDLEWEENCASTIKHLWMTDCESLHSYINNPSAAGTEDKRLEIDLQGLREYIWEYPDGSLKDYITEDQHDCHSSDPGRRMYLPTSFAYSYKKK